MSSMQTEVDGLEMEGYGRSNGRQSSFIGEMYRMMGEVFAANGNSINTAVFAATVIDRYQASQTESTLERAVGATSAGLVAVAAIQRVRHEAEHVVRVYEDAEVIAEHSKTPFAGVKTFSSRNATRTDILQTRNSHAAIAKEYLLSMSGVLGVHAKGFVETVRRPGELPGVAEAAAGQESFDRQLFVVEASAKTWEQLRGEYLAYKEELNGEEPRVIEVFDEIERMKNSLEEIGLEPQMQQIGSRFYLAQAQMLYNATINTLRDILESARTDVNASNFGNIAKSHLARLRYKYQIVSELTDNYGSVLDDSETGDDRDDQSYFQRVSDTCTSFFQRMAHSVKGAVVGTVNFLQNIEQLWRAFIRDNEDERKGETGFYRFTEMVKRWAQSCESVAKGRLIKFLELEKPSEDNNVNVGAHHDADEGNGQQQDGERSQRIEKLKGQLRGHYLPVIDSAVSMRTPQNFRDAEEFYRVACQGEDEGELLLALRYMAYTKPADSGEERMPHSLSVRLLAACSLLLKKYSASLAAGSAVRGASNASSAVGSVANAVVNAVATYSVNQLAIREIDKYIQDLIDSELNKDSRLAVTAYNFKIGAEMKPADNLVRALDPIFGRYARRQPAAGGGGGGGEAAGQYAVEEGNLSGCARVDEGGNVRYCLLPVTSEDSDIAVQMQQLYKDYYTAGSNRDPQILVFKHHAYNLLTHALENCTSVKSTELKLLQLYNQSRLFVRSPDLRIAFDQASNLLAAQSSELIIRDVSQRNDSEASSVSAAPRNQGSGSSASDDGEDVGVNRGEDGRASLFPAALLLAGLKNTKGNLAKYNLMRAFVGKPHSFSMMLCTAARHRVFSKFAIRAAWNRAVAPKSFRVMTDKIYASRKADESNGESQLFNQACKLVQSVITGINISRRLVDDTVNEDALYSWKQKRLILQAVPSISNELDSMKDHMRSLTKADFTNLLYACVKNHTRTGRNKNHGCTNERFDGDGFTKINPDLHGNVFSDKDRTNGPSSAGV